MRKRFTRRRGAKPLRRWTSSTDQFVQTVTIPAASTEEMSVHFELIPASVYQQNNELEPDGATLLRHMHFFTWNVFVIENPSTLQTPITMRINWKLYITNTNSLFTLQDLVDQRILQWGQWSGQLMRDTTIVPDIGTMELPVPHEPTYSVNPWHIDSIDLPNRRYPMRGEDSLRLTYTFSWLSVAQAGLIEVAGDVASRSLLGGRF